jgi:hypothetical protein
VRRLGCLVLLLPALAFGVACLPVAQSLRPPTLDQAAATALILAADSARTAAFAAADPAPLKALFADPAIAPFLPELADLHRHGARVEEQDSSRRLVHWVGGSDGGEGVLQVAGQQRIAVDGVPTGPGWSRILRQWYAELRWSGARWLVVAARDLPPDQWWKA